VRGVDERAVEVGFDAKNGDGGVSV
jgi:hypothetical protein